MTRAKPALLLAGLLASASMSASCGERLVEDEPDPDDPRIACVPISVHVSDPDGGVIWLLDEEQRHPWWCTCVPEDEVDEQLQAWTNERAYETCVEFVEELGHDPALSTCGEVYDAGYWRGPYKNPFDDIEYCDEIGALPPRYVP